jgi:hypothetical protein
MSSALIAAVDAYRKQHALQTEVATPVLRLLGDE